MKHLLIAATAAAALVPTAAYAQGGASGTGVYAGLQGGYHDLCCGLDGGLFGGYLGFNAPVGETLVAGLEANANVGTSDISAEYGASAHLGFRTGAGLVFGRVGYQEVDLDGGPSDGDILYGLGGEFGLGTSTAFRVTLDTIDFDSTRLTAGISFHF
jgi:outer membrane immunogenic protein